jgi:hypothetical protein
MGILAPAAQASPFVGVYMEARVAGGTWVSGSYNTTTRTWTMPVLAVAPGATIEYNIYALWTGTVGTVNTKGTVATTDDFTITSLNPSGSSGNANGINQVKFNVYQTAVDPIQVSFETASTLSAADGWTLGTGASGGAVINTGTGLSGDRGNGYANLLGVKPSQGVGTYVGLPGGTPTAILLTSGSATVGGTAGSKTDSTILMSPKFPKDQTIVSGERINAPYIVVSETTTGSWPNDPIVVFNGVTLYQPWAEAEITIPTGGYEADLTIPGTTLTINANVGGSAHTTTTYHWTINSGGPLNIDTLVPSLTLTNEQLNQLALGGPLHTILLSVDTGDGQHALLGAPVPLTLVPEPATMVLLSVGGLIVAIRRRRAK